MKLEPCPYCCGTDIVLKYNTSYGHGDSGYDHARYTCTTCGLARGDRSDWGNEPTEAVKAILMVEWNNMAKKLKVA